MPASVSVHHLVGACAAALISVSAAATTARAADRVYAIRAATTTITLNNRWYQRLQSKHVRIRVGEGARMTTTRPKGAAKIVRLVFRLRAVEDQNQIFYGPHGTWLLVNHSGSVTFTATGGPGHIGFRRPVGVLADPNEFPGGAANGFLAEIVRPSSAPRLPNFGTEPFLTGTAVHIAQPKGGTVTIRMRNIRFVGTDPLAPAGSADWFPRAAIGAVMGDGVTVLHVRRVS